MSENGTAVANRQVLVPDAFDGIPLAIVVASATGSIVLVNSQAERLFGYRRQTLVGHPIESLIPERFRGAHPGFRQTYLTVAHARPMGEGRDLYALRADGREFPVEIGLNPIETEHGPMVLAAIVDISERKQREESTRAALLEKELLLGEIHHRVKNNLQIIHSLLDLQALSVDDDRLGDMLRAGQGRIRSMALIHQTLYQSQDFAKVDFEHFLSVLLPVITESYALRNFAVTSHIQAPEVRLPISVAIPCGLILNELVANAFKHAFTEGTPGNLWIAMTVDAHGEVRLAVSNDGRRLPDDFDVGGASTLGLRLVQLLTEQLHGALEVNASNPTRFQLRFKLP